MFTANADGTWQLFTRTIDIPSNASYSFLEVCIFARSKVATVQDAYISRPMMEEGSTYNGWTLSPDDMELKCGNILPSARSLAKGTVLETVNGTITSGDYEGCSSIHANASSAYIDVLQWNMDSLGLEAAEDYTLTFMAKGTGTVSAFFYSGSRQIMVEKTGAAAPSWADDGQAVFGLTPQWQRFRVHWSPALSSYLPRYCLLRAETGASATFAQPKLERGAVATDYTEKASDGSEELLATGIDIESRKITVTANMFEVRNNSGETTATVDENGRLSVSDGDFTGTVRAQNFFHNVHILGSTEKWLYITSSESDQLEVGKYYLESVVYDMTISEDWGGVPCIGAADLVLLPRDTCGAARYVVLPSAKDYEGKMVEIIDTGYSNVTSGMERIEVSSVDGGYAKFVKGVYTSGISSPAPSFIYLYDTNERTGKRIRFIALKIEDSYCWMEIEYIPGHS